MREYTSTPMQAAAFARLLNEARAGGGNLQVSISFGEAVAPEALREGWQAVSARHGILRSGFSRRSDGSVCVREVDSAEVFWKTLDWQSETAETIPPKWVALLESDAASAIDSAAAPAVRFHEIRLPGGGCHYLMTTPSFLLDESSLAFVLSDWLLAIGKNELPPASESAVPTVESPEIWKELLSGCTGTLVVRPRQFPATNGDASETLGRDETAALKAFCKDHSLEPATVLHAIWTLVLRRYGASGDVSFSSENLATDGDPVGYFENLIPVAHAWHGSVIEWLRDFEARRAATRANGRIDPQAALAAAGIAKAGDALPVVFSWRGPELNDVVRTRLPRWINFDAKIHASAPGGFLLEARDGFRLALKVSGPAWGAESAQTVLAHLTTLLAALPDLADKALRNVPVLEAEEVRTLRSWSRGPEGGERPASLIAAFRAVADKRAGHTAVVDGDYALTYGELEILSDKLAAHLAHAGLAGGWHVGLFLSQSSWIPIAILGALKAGNSIIPIDPAAPPEWVESTLAAHDAGVVLCDAASSPLLDTSNRRRIILDQEWETLESAEVPNPELTHDSPAAVLPGHPEGEPLAVRALTHGMLLSAFTAGARLLGFEAKHSFLAHSVAGGGAFLDEWFLPLLAGGMVRVADENLLDPTLADVSHVRLSAPEWANQAARSLRGEPLVSESIRVLAIEAGNPNARVLDIWEQKLPGASVVFYSPAGLCGLGLAGVAALTSPFLPVGKPLEDVECCICDPDGHELPPRFAGQLFLKFPGWKKLTEGSSRRGVSTGLLAWRDATGSVVVEKGESSAPGIPAFSQRTKALALLEDAIDAHVGSRVWTLGGPAGTGHVDEWPLTPAGWIDEPALPRPAEPVAAVATVSAPKSQPAPRLEVPWVPVEVLQKKGAGTRLVLIHPASGDPAAFADLASAIGPSRRVIAIRARGFGNRDECHPTIESAAAAYLDAVLEDDPTAPFVLSGFGFGTTVALEMARQLVATGRPAPHLVLIGGIAPQTAKAGGWLSSVKSVWKRMADEVTIEPLPHGTSTAAAHDAIWQRYRFEALDIDVDLIVPSDFTKETIAAWDEIFPEAGIEPVKCTWAEMLSFPAVKRIASLLNERH